jgi:hypothetical protein
MKLSNRLLLLIGIVASIVVGFGEYLLHYLPTGPSGEISMLLEVPLGRASVGHYFVVFGAPLYFVGYYGLKNILKTTSPLLSRLLFVCGVLSFTIGGVWVSSRYFAAEVLQRSIGTSDYAFYFQSYKEHYQVLVWVLRILVAAVSLLYVILILKNKLGLPKWLAIFNPIILLILVISSLFWCKALGNHIAPIAMNVAHFIFFGLLLSQLNKSTLT